MIPRRAEDRDKPNDASVEEAMAKGANGTIDFVKKTHMEYLAVGRRKQVAK